MNKYETAFIKKYIEQHKSEIDSVVCGMKEDWNWTAETVYEDGEFLKKYDWNSTSIMVAGIGGSVWATPVMEVNFNDGRTELVPCFFDDGEQSSASHILQAKRFALMTGGKEYE